MIHDDKESPMTGGHGIAQPEALPGTIQALYAFAYLVCGDRMKGLDHVRGLFSTGKWSADQDELVGSLARRLDQGRERRNFSVLDAMLRSEPTVAPDDEHLDADDLRALAWELRRACLVATLGCLPPGLRVAFVLTAVLGYSPADGAALLGISEVAFRVRFARARKQLERYLGPRCEHVDRRNPCVCAERVGTAMAGGLVQRPLGPCRPVAENDGGQSTEDVAMLFARLTGARLDDEELLELVAQFTGERITGGRAT